jgi:hypothetical protein
VAILRQLQKGCRILTGISFVVQNGTDLELAEVSKLRTSILPQCTQRRVAATWGADNQELALVAAGKLRLPQVRLDVKELLRIPTGSVTGNKAMQAVLADREEEL